MKSFTKDPDSTLDYVINWSNWLDSDAISTSSWTVSSGITNESESNTSTTATIWLSGGTAGETYRVTNRIVTSGGRTVDRSNTITIREK